jgi:hypothetical protein
VSGSRAAVEVLKLTAAQRQLDAAIRMSFGKEDSLAIHTVAAAACRLLRDLKGKRGLNVLAEEWRDNLLGVARAAVSGRCTNRGGTQSWQSVIPAITTSGPTQRMTRQRYHRTWDLLRMTRRASPRKPMARGADWTGAFTTLTFGARTVR